MKPSSYSKKYKALMLDVDGTIISFNEKEILPSEKVTKAIIKASKKIHVGLATSRPLTFTKHLIEHLQLTSPCIISNGAQIYDPVNKKNLYEIRIDKNVYERIFKIVDKYHLILLDDGRGEKGDLKRSDVVNPIQAWIEIPDQRLLEAIFKELSDLPSVSVQKLISRYDGDIELIVGHTKATKQHGIFEFAKMLDLSTEEIIGVGDGPNDFPLLMACGLKVAMGNGVEDLKTIADYIAPPVTEDGIADVINKFVL